MTSLLFLLSLWLGYLTVEAFRLRRWQGAIPLRVAVTGTRGKSTVVRLLAAVLREDGWKVLAKTTGSEASLILPDGSERTLRRRGRPSILEQVRLLALGARLGADVVVHSMTKFLNGHADAVAGMIVVKNEGDYKNFRSVLNQIGGVIDPFNSFLVARGIKTLALRMERHSENSIKIASYLKDHPKVDEVYFPWFPSHPQHEISKRQMKGAGGMISFELKGGIEAGKTAACRRSGIHRKFHQHQCRWRRLCIYPYLHRIRSRPEGQCLDTKS